MQDVVLEAGGSRSAPAEGSTQGMQSFITHSPYFCQDFNSAIFDGPIRIYFAQRQEASALKIYYNLSERYSNIRQAARGLFQNRGTCVFLLIYPTDESFAKAFPMQIDAFLQEIKFGNDYVVGMRGALENSQADELYRLLDAIVS